MSAGYHTKSGTHPLIVERNQLVARIRELDTAIATAQREDTLPRPSYRIAHVRASREEPDTYEFSLELGNRKLWEDYLERWGSGPSAPPANMRWLLRHNAGMLISSGMMPFVAFPLRAVGCSTEEWNTLLNGEVPARLAGLVKSYTFE